MLVTLGVKAGVGAGAQQTSRVRIKMIDSIWMVFLIGNPVRGWDGHTHYIKSGLVGVGLVQTRGCAGYCVDPSLRAPMEALPSTCTSRSGNKFCPHFKSRYYKKTSPLVGLVLIILYLLDLFLKERDGSFPGDPRAFRVILRAVFLHKPVLLPRVGVERHIQSS